ncbi:PAI3-like protein [Saccharomyces kudriavzevii IFO 1802]|uniref:PAI3-like protein n=1 Tax=Saccharomyces kudriavzevii (strain ATCC MYA-4449 / AS 2.2408 / CBS 8840 / NBRC 1802 / NCYC 2889) TaxID=226230 RepID=J6EDV1_SACK1|nr:PAI3-like protein [Saccharomyces kudriavzevii IFO 1802]
MNTDQQKVNEIFQSSKEKLQGDAKVVNDAFKEMASKDKNGKDDNISDNTRKPDYQEQYNKLKGAGHRNE